MNRDRTPARGSVVALTADHRSFDTEHEHLTRAEAARRLAELKRYAYCGEYDRGRDYAKPLYFVPSDTIAGHETAGRLGIRHLHDLFGGVVPHPFVATKVITHPLVDADAARPTGWHTGFGERVGEAVLDGFSAFAYADARRAGLQLLAQGPVRIKPACATGGRGQTVVKDAEALARCLDAMAPDDLQAHGVVLEENLQSPLTFSVGQVIVDDTIASYHGVQRETSDNRGATAYGGSDLNLVRGGFDTLLAQPLAPAVRLAIQQAQRYHAAVADCFPSFFASRINYDIVQGRAADGQSRSGVLEQSWRIGGATGAEIAALETFRDRPSCSTVRASCFEAYGRCTPPPDATFYFDGVDAQAGPLVKYTVIQTDADAH